MTDSFTKYRNSIIHGLYAHILKPVFFMNDPETVHDRMARIGAFLGRSGFGRTMTSSLFDYENEILKQKVLGIEFRNPVGLSAGFDKNAELTDILPSVGFGFAEVGSITGEPCEGNPKPRLWRLPKSQSLVVYYGLKNDGCEAISARLSKKKALHLLRVPHDSARPAGGVSIIPIGMSVAMTNCAANADIDLAIKDYAKAFKTMEPLASYITVNISCPNTSGGQPFVEPDKLDSLFKVLDLIPTNPNNKPVFIKLSPDLNLKQIDAILEVAKKHRIHGIITTNLTKKRDNPKIADDSVPTVGGLSGKVVQGMSDDMLSYIYRKKLIALPTGKPFILIGSGGVFNAEDAYKKIRLGASLVQMITGMIFEGPQVVSEINRGIAELLKRDGFKKVSEAIGADSC